MGLSTKQVSSDDHELDNWSQGLLQSSEYPRPPPIKRQHHNQQPEPLNCPRCDSTNTKFCYYNNYNKSQPRHFCKECKRHWTKGGTLRNVPVGGGRKNKRHKPSQRTSTSTTTTTAITSTSQSQPQFSNLPVIHQPCFLNDNALMFNMENYFSGNFPPNDQTLHWSFSSMSSNSDTNLSSNIASSFQSLSGYKYNEKAEITMEESIITSAMPQSDVCQEWELAAPISTSCSVMELPSSFWNWNDFDTKILGSSADDINIPWDETEIKP